ncbi:MAG: RNA polymerase sigma factor [Litorimonas sp.]
MRAHQGVVRAFLRRLTRNEALADDLAQDTFLKAYQNKKQLKDIETSRAWLFQIAYRTYVDDTRKDIRRRGLAEQNIVPVDETTRPQNDMQMDIERAMDTLDPECRAVVILCLAYGFSHVETSQATHMPLGTVKSHVLRGKSKLRTFLSDYERAS